MTRKYSKIRYSVLNLALTVTVAGTIAVVAAVELTSDPQYWISGATLVGSLVLPVLAKAFRGVGPSSRSLLDEAEKELRAAVMDQWSGEVERRVCDPYPLPVPFSVATSVTF